MLDGASSSSNAETSRIDRRHAIHDFPRRQRHHRGARPQRVRWTGLFRAPWRVTDRVEIPADAVSGYYEAKLEIVGGAHAGAVGSVPLIVRQSPAASA